jgi:hypothetical protein
MARSYDGAVLSVAITDTSPVGKARIGIDVRR